MKCTLKIKRLLLLLAMGCSFSYLHAQTGTSLGSWLQSVSASQKIRFFYDPSIVDLNKTLQLKPGLSWDQQLKLFLEGTDIRFSIDNENHVFLTPGMAVVTGVNLPQQSRQDPADLLAVLSGDNKKRTVITLADETYTIGVSGSEPGKPAVISGTVKNQRSGEAVVNAAVIIDSLRLTARTDLYGNWSLSVPKGNHTLTVQSMGMKDAEFKLKVLSSGILDIPLKEQVAMLKNVVVSANKVNNIKSTQMGVDRLSIAAIKNVPSVFGEADVMRVVTMLPGVKTLGEVSTGFNVRGGSTDQNLILFNGSTIYNPAHFFGMFSSFNPDLIKDIELIKSGLPAKYGGRLASVLNITSREGNKKEYHGTAGIGVVTSRLAIDGPIGKSEKTSFIFGARTTYANWLLKLLPDEYDNSKASFYDLNLGINHQLSQNDDLFLNGYMSRDAFKLASDTSYNYQNKNLSLRWRHRFSTKLNSMLTLGTDHYGYGTGSRANKYEGYDLQYRMQQFTGRADFTYVLNPKHTMEFGLTSVRYNLKPGVFLPDGDSSLIQSKIIQQEFAQESGAYISEVYNVTDQLSINAGLRYSYYQFLGPSTVNQYVNGLPREESSKTGSRYYDGGTIKHYGGLEYRASLRYAFSNTFSAKLGYNTAYQFIHMLSNTMAIAPTDIWKLSDPNIKPQRGEQLAFGLYKNLKNNTIELSAETYYKRIKDYLDYKSGAKLILNDHIETDVINTRGKAYGFEFSAKKTVGKLNGWIAYTYSRILLQMNDSTVSKPVNNGEYYPAAYDKPHDITIAGNFKVNQRFSISMTSTYATGRPITIPVGRFYYAGSPRVLYSDRNTYRIPDYYRTDLSLNIDGNHKVHQKTHNSWTIGVYNLLGRHNAYSIYFISQNGKVDGYKLSIFGSAIPFINFNIKF